MSISTVNFGVVTSIEERELLRRVAKRRGISPNALLRELINTLRDEDAGPE